MVIIEITSGLGNQLFQYASARSLSLELGQKLIIDNSHFLKNNFRQPKLQFFNLKATFTVPYNRPAHKLFHRYVSLFSAATKKINEPEWWNYVPFDKATLKKFKVIKLEGGWAALKHFEKYADLIKKDISLKSVHKKSIAPLIEEVSHRNSVAIHIRKGDYVQSPEAMLIFNDLDISYYQQAIELIRSKINEPHFYIFTNDADWVKANFNHLEDKNCTYVSEKYKLEDYQDFEVMRSCRHQIIANSTFSWWAAFLNTNKDKMIIQPRNWYKHTLAQHNYENGDVVGIIGTLI